MNFNEQERREGSALLGTLRAKLPLDEERLT